ncbi:FG-GAP repeat domain-containing protein [Streptomyces sp. NPDC002889]|uniref:FG-GAP repeat domain-containing protein n=1 Tax=Streptomyces sp. NPDC002889 TaxID=3364669 RepID=UPI003699D665
MRKRAFVCLGILLAVTTACSGSSTADKPKQRPAAVSSASASDFNGDGYSDLVVTDSGATVQGVHDAGEVVVVHGSAKGPDTARRKVIVQNDLGLGKAGPGGNFGAHSLGADLDSDGYADLVATAGRKTLFVVWGGKRGLSASGAARLTGMSPVAGDFNGDGYTDLVSTDTDTDVGTLSLGPFTRAGEPEHTVRLDLAPEGEPFTSGDDIATPSAAGDVTGDGRDDLVVTWSIYGDGDYTSRATVLYRGAADGRLTKGPRVKNAQGKDLYGQAPVTADIDKDGYADIVMGLACETRGDPMPPEGGSRVEVSYGGPEGQSTRLKPVRITEQAALPGSPKFAHCGFGHAVSAGDTNGDGYADLAFGGQVGTDAVGRPTVILLLGSAEGLTTRGARLFSQLTPGIPGSDAIEVGFGQETALLDTDRDHSAELAIGSSSSPGGTDPIVWVLPGSARGISASRTVTFDQGALGIAHTAGRGSYGFGR